MPRPGSQSHRLSGSWAYDHGVAANLSCNASTRVNCWRLSRRFVNLCRPVRPTGVGQT